MRFVVDADGMIKLNKAGVLELLAQQAEILIGPEVFREVVQEGKVRGYPDAFEIEEIITRQVTQKRPKARTPADHILKGIRLGPGEQETLRLYFSEGADAIVSDDQKFLNWLDSHNVPYLTPAAVLVLLVERDILSRRRAKAALEKLRPYIRDEQYERARRDMQRRERNS